MADRESESRAIYYTVGITRTSEYISNIEYGDNRLSSNMFNIYPEELFLHKDQHTLVIL